MRAVVQRVSEGSVTVAGRTVGKIERGLVVLLGVGIGDGEREAQHLANKVACLRIFEDAQGKMNLSALDLGLEILVVSQFTLYADCRRGRRPSFIDAAQPHGARALVGSFVEAVRKLGLSVETGEFQSHMLVDIKNDGPVTIFLDTADVGKP